MKENKTVYVKARITPKIDQTYREICEGLGLGTATHMRMLLESFISKHQSTANEVFVNVTQITPDMYEASVHIPSMDRNTAFFDYTEFKTFKISPLSGYSATGQVKDVQTVGLVLGGVFKAVISTSEIYGEINDAQTIREYLTRIFTLMLPAMRGFK